MSRRLAIERVAVAATAALYLYATCFRDGTFVYVFHKVGTGAWLDEGVRVAAGEVPYRDFVDRVGPGLLYLYALLVRVFGPRLDVMAWVGLAMGCAVTVALHALACVVVRGPWRLAPPAVFLFLVFPGSIFGSHVWAALLLSSLATLALARDRGSPFGSAAAAGTAGGFAVAFTPGLGAAVVAGLLLHIAVERAPGWRRRAAWTAGAALLAVAVPAAALAAKAPPAAVMDGWMGLRPPAGSLLDLSGRWGVRMAGWLALALTGAAAAVGPALSRGDASGRSLVARVGLLALVPAAVAGGDPHALAVHGSLLAVSAAAAAQRAGQRGEWAVRARTAAAVVVCFCTLYSAAATLAWRRWIQPTVRQRFRAGEAWIGSPNRELAWLESRARPGEAVFVFPAGGACFFLTQTRNATSFPTMVEGVLGEEQQRQAIAEIEAARPAVGIWIAPQRIVPPPGAPRLDTLYEGVFRSYVTERALPDGTLLLRRRE